jgi:hypothetical protein
MTKACNEHPQDTDANTDERTGSCTVLSSSIRTLARYASGTIEHLRAALEACLGW